MKKSWNYKAPGIPDEYFVRGKVPMTKEEVRILTMVKARLLPDHVVWDIGSGTGSLTVEAARLVPEGMVYAVERSPEGVELTRHNVESFGLANVQVIPGEAPDALALLPDPDRVLIGGSGGNLPEIVEILQYRLKPGGRLVINAVTLQTVGTALANLGLPWHVEVIQMGVARGVPAGGRHLMKALNPVFIISAERGEDGVAG